MHSPRIPLDFDFSSSGRGFHIASGDTGAFWFGLLVVLGMTWELWQGFREGGDFGLYHWPFPPADRDHPFTYWAMAIGNSFMLLVGVVMVVCGLIGLRPF